MTRGDLEKITSLTRHARRVHHHLDWQPLAAWVGRRPFYFAMDGARPAGVFAAPPDPPNTAWVRLFAVADGVPAGDVLRAVWPAARRDLESDNARLVATLALDGWVGAALATVGFQKVNEVVVLSRSPGVISFPNPLLYSIRPFNSDDLPAVGTLDSAAFDPPWQISATALRLALEHAAWATVVEIGDPPRVAGYQISTTGGGGRHLARLAVLPEYQGRGIATALVADVIEHFASYGDLTVNTQQDNHASLAVYQRLGFEPTGQQFGAWQMSLG